MNLYDKDGCRQDRDREKRDILFVTWIGVAINIVLSGLKLAAGIFASSQAVIADSVHSLSDLGTDFLVLFGMKFWSAPADETHPYGHQRIETIITAFIGVALAFAGLGIAYNALSGIRAEHLRQPGWMAFAAAALSIVSKEALYRWTVAVGKKAKSFSVVANAWHHRSDAFSSIPVAIAVAAAAINPKWSFLDHIGAVIVTVFILKAAWDITRSSLRQLSDEAVTEEERLHIQDLARQTPGVRSIHAVRTRRMGAGILVDLHVMVDGALSVKEGHEISREVKNNLKSGVEDIIDVIVHLEPFD